MLSTGNYEWLKETEDGSEQLSSKVGRFLY